MEHALAHIEDLINHQEGGLHHHHAGGGVDQGAIVEDATKDDFFGKPHSERAQNFLAKILQH